MKGRGYLNATKIGCRLYINFRNKWQILIKGPMVASRSCACLLRSSES